MGGEPTRMGRLVISALLVAAVYLWLRARHIPELQERGLRFPPMLLALLYLLSPVDLVPDAGAVGFLDDILILLSVWWWARQQARSPHQGEKEPEDSNRGQKAPGATAEAEQRWDPYKVLGVERGASREQIARAYREQMKRYHPDRVADLGKELQEVAHRKTIEIQRAYEELN